MLACRPMLPLAAAAVAGVLAMRFLPGPTWLLPLGWIVFLELAAWFLLSPAAPPPAVPDRLPAAYVPHIMPRPGFIARRGVNRFILLLCLACLLFAMQRQEWWRQRMNPGNLPEKRYITAVLLMDGPARRHAGEEGRVRVPARLMLADGRDAGQVRVQFNAASGAPFRRGDLVRARVRVTVPRVKSHPGAFDARFWLERDGLLAAATAVRPGKSARHAYPYTVIPLDAPPTYVRFMRGIDAVRARAITATLEYGGVHGPMLAGMIYGYRDDIDKELNAVFQRVGIGHVLSISGLHVGLIVGMLWWVVGLFSRSARGRAAACLVLAVLYLGLSGGQVAAVRATLMGVVYLGGVMWGRRSDMLNSLGAAAFLIVLDNPTAPVDISFQLSFTAVVFIYAGLRGTAWRSRPSAAPPRGLDRRRAFLLRLRREFESLTRLSVATWLGLYPIVATVFNQVNLIGLPFNIFVVPWSGVVLACGILLPALGWIPGMARLLLLPSDVLTATAAFSDSIPWSSFPVNAPNAWWMAAFFAAVFLFLLHGTIRSQATHRLWVGFTSLGVAAMLAGTTASMASLPPPPGGRIALLPSGGVGVLAVEASGGGMALVGQFRGGGRDEASWLHSVRRRGSVAVLALGRREEDRFGALAYHFPIASFTNIPYAGGDAAGAVPEWRVVAAANGVEYAVFRNARDRVFAVAARCDGKALISLSRAGADDILALCAFLRERADGFDACFVALGHIDPAAAAVAARELPPWVIAGYRGRPGETPPGWFDMNGFGAVTLGEGVSAFDGSAWRRLRPPDGAGGR